MPKKDIWLVLTPDAGPFNSIRHLFPKGRIPVVAPFPNIVAGDEQEPCFQMDWQRLTVEQADMALAALCEKYASGGMNYEIAKAEIEKGLPISQRWCANIEGDDFFEDVVARQAAFEFNHLSNEPSIDIRISPLAGWSLICQIQLALRHPANVGFLADEARRAADLIEQSLQLGNTLKETLGRGKTPEFDVAAPPEMLQPKTAKYADLDINRKQDILGNCRSLLHACQALEKITRLSIDYWTEEISEAVDAYLDDLSEAEINKAIAALDHFHDKMQPPDEPA